MNPNKYFDLQWCLSKKYQTGPYNSKRKKIMYYHTMRHILRDLLLLELIIKVS